MIIKYYKDENLVYSNRKRYSVIPAIPISTEEQKRVSLNDGAKTYIKTSVDNLCDYVVMTDKKGKDYRWYVVSYTYLNGEQIILNLQRDVIGEFGFSNAYGNIERGYTNGILKNRKELNLNEQLKSRIPLKPDSKQYGYWKTNTHDDEAWGILYFVRPTTEGGSPYQINIPKFSPTSVSIDDVPADGEERIVPSSILQKSEINLSICTKIDLQIGIFHYYYYYYYSCSISFEYDFSAGKYKAYNNISYIGSGDNIKSMYDNREADIIIDIIPTSRGVQNPSYKSSDVLTYITYCINKYTDNILSKFGDMGFTLPNTTLFPDISYIDYTGNIYNNNNVNYVIKSERATEVENGNVDNERIHTALTDIFNSITIVFKNVTPDIILNPESMVAFKADYVYAVVGNVWQSADFEKRTQSSIEYDYLTYSHELATSNNTPGIIDIDTSISFIDEPYYVFACPLFDCSLSGGNSTYPIKKDAAFSIFNEVIASLSGESGYLIDAQIIPYAPDLSTTVSVLTANSFSYPLFQLSKNNFTRKCTITAEELGVLDDVKKEYIEKVYSIASPDKSSDFKFNYYDYFTSKKDISFAVKCALKPFAVIMSCVILRDNNCLIGNYYETDLQGSQPSSNGFECSLVSDAFEAYKRQNANYQQIFEVDRNELIKQHQVEKVNEEASIVINTMTSGFMGAIGGASLADVSFFGNGAKAAGAAVGLATATATTATAMTQQFKANEELRAYEENLQKQRFDLAIGTIKALPNSVNRISSFNEILLKEFYFVIEVYSCTDDEKIIVDNFINKYGYALGIFDYFENYYSSGKFLRGNVITSSLLPVLHNVLVNEIKGGIYYE